MPLVLFLAQPGCQRTAAQTRQENRSAAPRSGLAWQQAVRILGRAKSSPDGIAYAWSGAGFLVRVRGTEVAVELSDPGNLHSILVDGQRTGTLTTQPGRRSYVLAKGLNPGEHTVGLARRTEALFGPTILHRVSVPHGELLAPPARQSRSLEIIGDSISCGYGNLGASPTCSFSAETEDHYLSYGRLLAGRLHADLSTVAWSGRGVVKNYGGEAGSLMPQLYERTLPEDERSHWDFQRGADYVVINLGTNDFSTEPDPAPAEFSREYEKLLARVRQVNPSARIIATIGPMLVPDDNRRAEAAIGDAVAARRLGGDLRVEFHPLVTKNEHPGCDYHPGLETHRLMAEELLAALTER